MEIEPEDGEDGEEEGEIEVDESEIIEIDGVKYAPIVTEEDEEEDEDENPFAKDDEVEESEELDLEAVIKELEDELSEDEEVEEDESVNEVEDDELDEYSGTRVEKRKKSGNAPRINNEEVEEDLTESDPDEEEKVVKEEEDSESEAVEEAEEKDETKETNESETSELQNELNEYKEAVTYLRDKLHEVNILNAKLLYTNKLFKEYVLSNDQKLKIVETFDRAQTTREIKLVYTTLAESFKPNEGEKKNEVVKEFASKKSGGTAPKTKIITEESQVADRFRKLAGIL